MAENSVTIRGLAPALQNMQDVEDRMKDLSPILGVAAAEMVTFLDDRFDTESDPTGAAWAPLADSTIARRRGTVAKIGTDTARMRNSAHAEGTAGSLVFGLSVEYAEYFNDGTFNQPARRVIPVDRDGGLILDSSGPGGALWDSIRERVLRYVTEGIIG